MALSAHLFHPVPTGSGVSSWVAWSSREPWHPLATNRKRRRPPRMWAALPQLGSHILYSLRNSKMAAIISQPHCRPSRSTSPDSLMNAPRPDRSALYSRNLQPSPSPHSRAAGLVFASFSERASNLGTGRFENLCKQTRPKMNFGY